MDWAYCKTGQRRDSEKNKRVSSKKDWQVEVKMEGDVRAELGKMKYRIEASWLWNINVQ